METKDNSFSEENAFAEISTRFYFDY